MTSFLRIPWKSRSTASWRSEAATRLDTLRADFNLVVRQIGCGGRKSLNYLYKVSAKARSPNSRPVSKIGTTIVYEGIVA